MTLAQSKINLVQRLLQTDNKHTLKVIESVFNQEDEFFELSKDQKKELDKELDEIESDKAKFYTMTEVKKMLFKKLKK